MHQIAKKDWRYSLLPTALLALFLLTLSVRAADTGNVNMTPEESYRQLVAGNARFLGKATDAANKLPSLSTAEDRYPIATILYSSDMPKSPDQLTKLTSNDLYLVPLQAGAVTKEDLADLEYGIMELKTPMVVVMTHYPSRDIVNVIRQYDALGVAAKAEAEKVAASGNTLENSSEIEEKYKQYNLIGPAIARAKEAYPEAKGEELANIVCEAMAWQSLEAILMQSSATQDLIKAGSIDAIAAIVDDQSGTVVWLGAHPLQEEFLKPLPDDMQAEAAKIKKTQATDTSNANDAADTQTVNRKVRSATTVMEPQRAVVREEDIPEPLPETVINNYINEYNTNNYYTSVVDDYYFEPVYYQPSCRLFYPRVWCYRPWFGCYVRPFVPWPYYNPWWHAGWGYPQYGCGFSVWGGSFNLFIGFNRHWGPPLYYGHGFRPRDPYWGHHGGPGRPGGPGGPGWHGGLGRPGGPGHDDPIRDLVSRGRGDSIRPLDRDSRPGYRDGGGRGPNGSPNGFSDMTGKGHGGPKGTGFASGGVRPGEHTAGRIPGGRPDGMAGGNGPSTRPDSGGWKPGSTGEGSQGKGPLFGNTTRPGGNSTTPGDRGNAIGNTTRPGGGSTTPGDRGNAIGNTTRPGGSSTTPGDRGNAIGNTTRPGGSSTTPGDRGNAIGNTTRPGGSSTTPGDRGNAIGNTTRLGGGSTTPGDRGNAIGNTTRLGGGSTTPGDRGNAIGNTTRPGGNSTTPGDRGNAIESPTRPSGSSTTPGDRGNAIGNTTRPGGSSTTPGDRGSAIGSPTRPGGGSTTPADQGSAIGGSTTRPSGGSTTPGDRGNAIGNTTRPSRSTRPIPSSPGSSIGRPTTSPSIGSPTSRPSVGGSTPSGTYRPQTSGTGSSSRPSMGTPSTSGRLSGGYSPSSSGMSGSSGGGYSRPSGGMSGPPGGASRGGGGPGRGR